jgi:hypothetical protein
MIKNLRNLRDGELTRKSTEFEQVQNLLITYDYLFIFDFFIQQNNCFRTRDNRFDDLLDLYVQIVLKQGQIEVESQSADLSPDQYRNTDMELINRREVEDLNKSIIVNESNSRFQFLNLTFFQESANLKIRQMEKTKGVVNELQSMTW